MRETTFSPLDAANDDVGAEKLQFLQSIKKGKFGVGESGGCLNCDLYD